MENDFYIGIIIGFVLGIFFVAIRIQNKVDSLIKNQLDEDIKKLDRPILFTELHNDVILVYNNKTNNFVCQGKNLDELVKNLSICKIQKAFLIHHNGAKKMIYTIQNDSYTEVK